MQKVDITKLKKNSLVDINTAGIDNGKDYVDKCIQYWEQIKNPYAFICCGIKVKIEYSKDSSESLEDILAKYFVKLKKNGNI